MTKTLLDKIRGRLTDNSISDVIQFANDFKNVSPYDLSLILEHLHNRGMLNGNGEDFRTSLWEVFVREHE